MGILTEGGFRGVEEPLEMGDTCRWEIPTDEGSPGLGDPGEREILRERESQVDGGFLAG